MGSAAEPIELTISELAYGGDGVARHEGQVIFIPFTAPGEKVKVLVTEVHKTFSRGRLLEVIEPSADRVVPPCSLFMKCGGCRRNLYSLNSRLLSLKLWIDLLIDLCTLKFKGTYFSYLKKANSKKREIALRTPFSLKNRLKVSISSDTRNAF